MSKDLFILSLLIAGSVSWVGGSVSYYYEGLDQKGFWIIKALEKCRSLGEYIYIPPKFLFQHQTKNDT